MDVTVSRCMSCSFRIEETMSDEILIANHHHGMCNRNGQVRVTDYNGS